MKEPDVARVPASAQSIPLGAVRFGDLKRLSPIGHDFGYERGTPVDRYYIEGFLARNAADIRGCVLEVGWSNYTKRFGGDRVERSDVLALDATNPDATIVGDVTQAGALPEAAFDCIIFVQTLQYLADARAAVDVLYGALKPGGVLLVTAPGIGPVGDHPGRPDRADRWPWHRVFTPLALQRLLTRRFAQHAAVIETHGNIFAATAFLYGLAVEELDTADLDFDGPRFPVTVAARASKPA